jgi:myotubularin-related protein 5/13
VVSSSYHNEYVVGNQNHPECYGDDEQQQHSNSRPHIINWSGANSNEHQTYAGYLKKQGALFKQWKERYFVLDSVKHQLRYYDTHNDSIAKGVIDLSEVEAITQGIASSLYVQQQLHQQQTNLAKKTLNGLITASNGGSSGGGGGVFGENDIRNCFELKTSKRVYYFCAKSPQDALKWVKQLETCCLDS